MQFNIRYVENTFNYHFVQQTDHSFIGKIFKMGREYSPIHGDEVLYLMNVRETTPNFNSADSSLSKQMIKYWTNFAKYGHPSPSSQDMPYWSPVTEEEKVNIFDYQVIFHR